jgi:hypothetical protein
MQVIYIHRCMEKRVERMKHAGKGRGAEAGELLGGDRQATDVAHRKITQAR